MSVGRWTARIPHSTSTTGVGTGLCMVTVRKEGRFRVERAAYVLRLDTTLHGSPASPEGIILSHTGNTVGSNPDHHTRHHGLGFGSFRLISQMNVVVDRRNGNFGIKKERNRHLRGKYEGSVRDPGHVPLVES